MTPEKIVIGNAELWLGDCREVLPFLPKHDLLLTDPPYGIAVTDKRRAGIVEAWDIDCPHDLVLMAVEGAERSIVFGGNYFRLPPSRGWLVWDKMISDGLNLAHAELAWTNLDRGVRLKRHMWSGPFREGNEQRNGHPTQKPIDVMRWCLTHADESHTVLDPFMGSGTTGVACAQMGKAFTGIERERRYFDIACERIARAQAQGSLIPLDSGPEPEQQGLL